MKRLSKIFSKKNGSSTNQNPPANDSVAEMMNDPENLAAAIREGKIVVDSYTVNNVQRISSTTITNPSTTQTTATPSNSTGTTNPSPAITTTSSTAQTAVSSNNRNTIVNPGTTTAGTQSNYPPTGGRGPQTNANTNTTSETNNHISTTGSPSWGNAKDSVKYTEERPQKPYNNPKLPNEVMSIVMNYMDNQDLALMRETCVAYRELASSILYSTIGVICQRSNQTNNRTVVLIEIGLGNMIFTDIRLFLRKVRAGVYSEVFKSVKSLKVGNMHMDIPWVPRETPEVPIEREDITVLLNWFVYILAPAQFPNLKTLDIAFSVRIDGNPPQFTSVFTALSRGFPNVDKRFILSMVILTNTALPDQTVMNNFSSVIFELLDTDPVLVQQVCGDVLPKNLTSVSFLTQLNTTAETLRTILSGPENLEQLTLTLGREIRPSTARHGTLVEVFPQNVKTLVLNDDSLESHAQSNDLRYAAEHIENLYIYTDGGYIARSFQFKNVKHFSYQSYTESGSLRPPFLPTFQSIIQKITDSLTTLRLLINIDMLSLLPYRLSQYPQNLKTITVSTIGTFQQIDKKRSPLENNEKSTLITVSKIDYRKMSGFFAFFLNYTKVYIYTLETWPAIDSYCKTFLIEQPGLSGWYQVDQQLFNWADGLEPAYNLNSF